MRDKFPVFSVLLLLLIFNAACGGSDHTKTPTEVPIIVSISDQPSRVGVLSFDLQITGACLLTGANQMATTCSGAQNVLPDAPMTVQLENMQTPQQSDVLATTNVQPDTYTAFLITFGSAAVTLNVDPHSTETDGTTSCSAANAPTVCELSPVLAPTFVKLPFTKPLTVVAGQTTSVGVDFNVADSLIGATAGPTTTFSITPAVGVSVNAGTSTDGNLIDVSGVTGPVTIVGGGTFTLPDIATGQAVTLTTASNTTFTGFSSCNNSLACVQEGQLITVNYGISNASIPVLTASSITNNNGFAPASAFQGTIIATTPTPLVIVTAIPAGNTQDLTVGEELTLVPPTDASGFSVAIPAGQTQPAGVSFAAQADLLVGQNVLIDATAVDEGVVTSDAIALEPTQFSGVVDVLTSPNLTVDDLDNSFNDRGISIIQVQTGTQTTFGGSIATTGFNGLNPGDEAVFAGFLFNGAEGQPPVVFGENVFDTGFNVDAVKR